MKIYTYFEPLNPDHEKVVELWRESWNRNGWTPVVLGESDYLSWEAHAEFDACMSRFPTINDPRYERACYRRWAVMANIGGGVCCDYDVMNFSFGIESMLAVPLHGHSCVLLDHNSPCVVVGTKSAFITACWYFMSYKLKPGTEHISDMHIANEHWGMSPFVRHPLENHRDLICREYGMAGWQKSPLVHFAAFAVKGRKSELIPRFMKEHNEKGKR